MRWELLDPSELQWKVPFQREIPAHAPDSARAADTSGPSLALFWVSDPPFAVMLSDPGPAGTEVETEARSRILCAPASAVGTPSGAAPSEKGPAATAVLMLSASELRQVETWEFLLKLFPAPTIDLARYSARNESLIPPEVFLHGLSLRSNYRALAEWKELGAMDDLSRRLSLLYDFPVNVLRLWNRLADEDRVAWLSVFEKHSVKKNLVREIIQDFYDLPSELRAGALAFARELSDGWKAKAQSRAFPAEEVRDHLRARRYPGLESLNRELTVLKRSLPGGKGLALELPQGLESDRLRLNLEFRSVSELRRLLKELDRDETMSILERMLKLL